MSNTNKETFSEFFNNSIETISELPEYLSIVDMNVMTEDMPQRGGNIETSTEQWNDFINNKQLNQNLLDTLSTPTNTAALEDKLVKLFEEAEKNGQQGGANHSMSSHSMSRKKRSKSKSKSKGKARKRSKQSKGEGRKRSKSKSKSKEKGRKRSKSKSKSKSKGKGRSRSKQTGGKRKRSKSKGKVKKKSRSKQSRGKGRKRSKSKGKSKKRSRSKQKGGKKSCTTNSKKKRKRSKSKSKSKRRMKREEGDKKKSSKPKKSNPGFQAYLDYQAFAREKVSAAGGPRGGREFSKFIKKFIDESKALLGQGANTADVYDKAKKLLVKELNTGNCF